jgi:cytoskeletal protein RodZ
MESFGSYLKSLREEKGVSLEEMSERTRIALTSLDFLEKDQYQLLPPRVFVKGFIRSYSQELGLDPETVLKRFDAFTQEGELSDYSLEDPVFRPRMDSRSIIRSPIFTAVIAIAGVLSLAILLVTAVTRIQEWYDTGGTALPSVATVGPSSSPAPATKGDRPTSAYPTAFPEPPRKQAGRKILEIKANANAWIRVQPDGGPAEELTMAPGDVQIFTAKNGFSFQTGNAGGIRLRFDGRELPPMGKDNQSLSLTLP